MLMRSSDTAIITRSSTGRVEPASLSSSENGGLRQRQLVLLAQAPQNEGKKPVMTQQDQSPYALNGHGVGEGRQFQRLVSAPVKSRFLLNRAGDCRFLDLDCRILLDNKQYGETSPDGDE
jgi:hypothetical protein